MAQERQALNANEEEVWNAEFTELTTLWDGHQQGERIRLMYERNREFIHSGAEIAKAQFGGSSFNGIDAQGGFGWQQMRPEHVLHATTDADSVNIDWKRNVATVGFNFFIGTNDTANQINRRALVVLLGIFNHNPAPTSVGVQLQIEGILYPPYDYYWAMKAPEAYRVFSFPKPKIVPKLGNLRMLLRDVDTGADEPQLLGITYAESGYLQTRVPDLESP